MADRTVCGWWDGGPPEGDGLDSATPNGAERSCAPAALGLAAAWCTTCMGREMEASLNRCSVKEEEVLEVCGGSGMRLRNGRLGTM